jgi:hypothetical protein
MQWINDRLQKAKKIGDLLSSRMYMKPCQVSAIVFVILIGLEISADIPT